MRTNTKTEKVEIDDDFGLMLNCAIRYSLGRQTYMPHCVIGYITPLLQKLDARFLMTAKRDLTGDGVFFGNDVIDKPAWLKFRDMIEDEIERRGLIDYG